MTPPGRSESYEVVIPGSVKRSIGEKLPETVAWAAIEFINGPLAANPHRVGSELRGRLQDLYSAHLGTFRVQYKIDDENRAVTVRRVEHRSDIYGLP